MYKYGKRSRANLKTCDERLVAVAELALSWSTIDITITEGHRSLERQRQLFAQNATTIDGVTRRSRHNESPSMAFDFAPYPVDWQDLRRFYLVAGVIIAAARHLEVPIRWGGDWDMDGQFNDQKFHDLPHVEIPR